MCDDFISLNIKCLLLHGRIEFALFIKNCEEPTISLTLCFLSGRDDGGGGGSYEEKATRRSSEIQSEKDFKHDISPPNVRRQWTPRLIHKSYKVILPKFGTMAPGRRRSSPRFVGSRFRVAAIQMIIHSVALPKNTVETLMGVPGHNRIRSYLSMCPLPPTPH